jgi:acyl carrier protein
MEKADPKTKIRNLLASHLGVEPQDIEDEDSLKDDLHINTADLSDLLKVLEQNGFDVSNLDFSEIETFEDLVETLSNNGVFE